MLEPLPDVIPNVDALITEDDTPVDNLPSEKQQRLLTEPLYSSWAGPGENRPFLAAANVGVFSQTRTPAIVPDMFLSLDVTIAEDWRRKEHRSYFIWEFGKPPELVLEIVSNSAGGEDTEKRKKYAWMKVPFYVIYDPQPQVMKEVLTIYRLQGVQYKRQETLQLEDLKLGLTLWEGEFEGKVNTWLRWTDEHGVVIPTGKERAEQEHQRAEHERQRAERFAALLRQAGIDPEQK
jgi:Uma2 family endonuclease